MCFDEMKLIIFIDFRSPMEWFHKFDCSAMAFNPPIPPPKPVDLNKPIKGRFFYVNQDVEIAVNNSISAPIQSDGHLLDFYKEIHSNSKKQ